MQIVNVEEGMVEVDITTEDVPEEKIFDEDYLYDKVKNFVLAETGRVIADKARVEERIDLSLGNPASWVWHCPF